MAHSKAYKEQSVLSIFEMLSSISGDVNGERFRQKLARTREGLDKYRVKGVFKVNKGGKCKVDG